MNGSAKNGAAVMVAASAASPVKPKTKVVRKIKRISQPTTPATTDDEGDVKSVKSSGSRGANSVKKVAKVTRSKDSSKKGEEVNEPQTFKKTPVKKKKAVKVDKKKTELGQEDAEPATKTLPQKKKVMATPESDSSAASSSTGSKTKKKVGDVKKDINIRSQCPTKARSKSRSRSQSLTRTNSSQSVQKKVATTSVTKKTPTSPTKLSLASPQRGNMKHAVSYSSPRGQPSPNSLVSPSSSKAAATKPSPQVGKKEKQSPPIMLTPKRGLQRAISSPILVNASGVVGTAAPSKMPSLQLQQQQRSSSRQLKSPPARTLGQSSTNNNNRRVTLSKSTSGGDILENMTLSTAHEDSTEPLKDSPSRSTRGARPAPSKRGVQRYRSDPTGMDRSLLSERNQSCSQLGTPLQKISENKVYRRPSNTGGPIGGVIQTKNVEVDGDDARKGDTIPLADKVTTPLSPLPVNQAKRGNRPIQKRSQSSALLTQDLNADTDRRGMARSKSDDLTMLSESLHRRDSRSRTIVRSRSGNLPQPQGILKNSSHHGPPTNRPPMKREDSKVSIPVAFTSSVDVIGSDDDDIEEVSIQFEPRGTEKDEAGGNGPATRPSLKRSSSMGSLNFSTHSLRSVRSQLSIDKELFEDDPTWKSALRWLHLLPPHKNENPLKRKIRIFTWLTLFFDFLAAVVAVTQYKSTITCCGEPIFSTVMDIDWDKAFRVLTAMYLVMVLAEIIPVVRQGLPFNVLNPLLGFAITFAMFFDDSVGEAVAMWVIEVLAVIFEFLVFRTHCRIYNETVSRIDKATQDLQYIKKSQRMIVQSIHESMHGSRHSIDLAVTSGSEDDNDDSSAGDSFGGNDSSNSFGGWNDGDDPDHSTDTKTTVQLDQSLVSQPRKCNTLMSQPSNRRSPCSFPSHRGAQGTQRSTMGTLKSQPSKHGIHQRRSSSLSGPQYARQSTRNNSSEGINLYVNFLGKGLSNGTSSHSSGGGSLKGSAHNGYHLPGEIKQNRLLRERRVLREHQKKYQLELRLEMIGTFFGVGLAIISLILIVTIASTGGLCIAQGATKIFSADQLGTCNQCSGEGGVCEVCPANGENQCYYPYY